jgi:predicted metal-dependent phosphoesterase TrpH
MVDLHTHSNRSDGSDDPADLVKKAAAAGLSALALTDHDRIDGVEEATAAGEELGVEVVAGCEISCRFTPGAMHMLVHFVTPSDYLETVLSANRGRRSAANQAIIEALAEDGFDISPEEVEMEAGGTGAGRPHIAEILMRKGYVTSVQDAFDRYIGKGCPYYRPKLGMSAEEVLALAARIGAVVTLAHPLSLGVPLAELDTILAELADKGLSGLECHYGRYKPAERKMLVDLATRHDLIATGGSDYHGTYKPDLSIGTGRGDLDVPDYSLAGLKDRLAPATLS